MTAAVSSALLEQAAVHHVVATSAESLAHYARVLGHGRSQAATEVPVAPLASFVVAWPTLTKLFATGLPSPWSERIIHVAQEATIERPLRGGEIVAVSARVDAWRPHPLGALVAASFVVSDVQCAVVAEQRTVALVHGVEPPTVDRPVRLPRAPAAGPPAFVTTVELGAELPERYAVASGDRNPVHLDPVAAHAIGLRGPIVHGMCTLGLAIRSSLEAAGIEPEHVRHVSARFGAAAYPSSVLTTEVTRVGETGLRLRSATEDGVVLRHVALELDEARP